MSLNGELLNRLNQFHTAPFLFVGSGLSRRYLGLDTWIGLLRRMSELTDRPYEYFRSSGDGQAPRIAAEIAKDLHTKWWDSDQFEESRERFKAEAINKESALKIELSRVISARSEAPPNIAEYQNELEGLQKATIDGIITTNWDLLLEGLFPDFKKYIGQEELLFSTPQSVGEIYKIHGCCSAPNSLIVTESDYAGFNARNPYLAAKLLTIFVEHPVIFIGYSLGDPNVSQILGSIASCLTSKNIDRLRDRLFIVQWTEGTADYDISNTSIITGPFTIPVQVVSTSTFEPVFEALGEIPRKFPARLLRRLKQHVYNLVQDNDPDNHLYVVDIDSESDLSGLDVVFGVGVKVVDDESTEGAVRLGTDPDAPVVRLATDPEAPELPYRLPASTEAYGTIEEELIGAVRAWMTDPNAYTPRSELWKFYENRRHLNFDKNALTCMLVSSMHHGCPVHYWAAQLGRDDAREVVGKQIDLDQYPAVNVAARLAFAIGMSEGEALLERIEKRSKYSSARTLAIRLRRALDDGATVWSEYRTPVNSSIDVGGEKLQVNVAELRDSRSEAEGLIDQIASRKKARALVRRLDAIIYGDL